MAESENVSGFAKKKKGFLRGLSQSGSAQSTARCSTGGILPKGKANQE